MHSCPMHDDHDPHLPKSVTVVLEDLRRQIAAEREGIGGLERQKIALESQIEGRRQRLVELEVTCRILFGGGPPSGGGGGGSPSQSAGRVSLAKPSVSTPPKVTHKHQSLTVLDGAPPEGMLAVEVIDGAVEQFPGQTRIERTSISPLLAKMANMKPEPLVEHLKETSRWRITEAGRVELEALNKARR